MNCFTEKRCDVIPPWSGKIKIAWRPTKSKQLDQDHLLLKLNLQGCLPTTTMTPRHPCCGYFPSSIPLARFSSSSKLGFHLWGGDLDNAREVFLPFRGWKHLQSAFSCRDENIYMSKNRHHFSSSSKLQFLLMAQSFAKFKENSSFIGEISQSQVIDDLRPPPALILLCSSVAAHQTWIFKSLSVANDRSFSYSDSVAQFQWIPIQYLFISTSSPVSRGVDNIYKWLSAKDKSALTDILKFKDSSGPQLNVFYAKNYNICVKHVLIQCHQVVNTNAIFFVCSNLQIDRNHNIHQRRLVFWLPILISKVYSI